MANRARVAGIGVAAAEGEESVPAIVLEVGELYVPIFVDPGQAGSISIALEGVQPPRPLTHDLLIEVLTDVGGAIDRVRIDDLRDDTFLAKIDAAFYVDGEGRERVFDCRPSDAIALALRVDCPIEVTDGVVEAAGVPEDEFIEGDPPGEGGERFRVDDDEDLR